MKEKIIKVVTLILRLVIIIIGLILIRYYIAPFVSLRVLNAGNVFGIGVGVILVLTGILWNPFCELIKNIWDGKAGKAILSIVCVFTVLFTAMFFTTLGTVIKHSKYTATDESVVIILGCQIRGSVPSSTLIARCRAAAEYLNEHPKAVAIATGGQGADEDLSEGQCIYNLLTEQGVDGNRIYIEDKSVNTDENIFNAKKIIDEKGLAKNGKVAVATSEYHEYRASLICTKNGLTASSVPSRSSKYAKPTFFTREVFGVWYQWITQS